MHERRSQVVGVLEIIDCIALMRRTSGSHLVVRELGDGGAHAALPSQNDKEDNDAVVPCCSFSVHPLLIDP